MRIAHPRFWAFLLGQFLGAFNDNAFKMVVSLAALTMFTDENARNSYLSLGQAIGILPFLLFASYAGIAADRRRKSTVLRYSKVLEIPSMILAMGLLASGAPYEYLLLTLFLLHTQLTFFSPAKWGLPPEVLPTAEISRANGLLNLTTYAAIVGGAAMGGVLWEGWKETPQTIGAFFVVVAMVGTLFTWQGPKPLPLSIALPLPSIRLRGYLEGFQSYGKTLCSGGLPSAKQGFGCWGHCCICVYSS